MGSAAIQLVKALGGFAIAVVGSEAKAMRCWELGAEHVIVRGGRIVTCGATTGRKRLRQGGVQDLSGNPPSCPVKLTRLFKEPS